MTDFEQKKIFSNNLSRLLDDRQLTQREVANRIGVSAQTFNTWCRGVAIPRMDKIQLLADYFHIDKSALIDPPSPGRTLSMTLTDMEWELLEDFRQLNDAGQIAALDVIRGLVAGGGFKKTVVENSVG